MEHQLNISKILAMANPDANRLLTDDMILRGLDQKCISYITGSTGDDENSQFMSPAKPDESSNTTGRSTVQTVERTRQSDVTATSVNSASELFMPYISLSSLEQPNFSECHVRQDRKPKNDLCGNWIEIAYGMVSGSVRVIVQHPETVGHYPKLFQTFTVHRAPITRVSLTTTHLISVCSEYNHVRSWSVTRFRGMINTQPGSTPMASFKVLTLESDEGSPSCGDGPQQQPYSLHSECDAGAPVRALRDGAQLCSLDFERVCKSATASISKAALQELLTFGETSHCRLRVDILHIAQFHQAANVPQLTLIVVRVPQSAGDAVDAAVSRLVYSQTTRQFVQTSRPIACWPIIARV